MSFRPYGFKISPLLQEHLCRLGSKLVFTEASEELGLLLGLSVNAKQIERLCHHYGELLQEREQEEPFATGDEKEPVTYAMADGSMLLTREEKWKEIKLGRIFKEESHLAEVSKDRGLIGSSLYCAHFGNSDEFWDRFTDKLPIRAKLVFICDGAKWLWNNINAYYPDSVQILDYFHCKEHLHKLAKLHFGENSEEGEAFVKKVMDCFLQSQIDDGIQLVEKLEAKKRKAKEKQEQLVNYLESNKKRIDYGKFKEQGYLIGSGPIESAHRNVIQKRLKLSGQRWTMKGAQQVANIRAEEKSGRWKNVQNLIVNQKNVA